MNDYDTSRRNTPEEMIAVILAHERGAILESREIYPINGDYDWGCGLPPQFNFAERQYRVQKVY